MLRSFVVLAVGCFILSGAIGCSDSTTPGNATQQQQDYTKQAMEGKGAGYPGTGTGAPGSGAPGAGQTPESQQPYMKGYPTGAAGGGAGYPGAQGAGSGSPGPGATPSGNPGQ